MWKPGKWVYVEEEEEQDEDLTNHQSKSAPAHQTTHHRRSGLIEPPSPPWKLGQVPIETSVFKDGRRMSKRFEKLVQDKATKQSSQNNITPSTTPTPTSTTTTTTTTTKVTRKERSKSVISNSNSVNGKDNSTQNRNRSRKSLTTTANLVGPNYHSSNSQTVQIPTTNQRLNVSVQPTNEKEIISDHSALKTNLMLKSESLPNQINVKRSSSPSHSLSPTSVPALTTTPPLVCVLESDEQARNPCSSSQTIPITNHDELTTVNTTTTTTATTATTTTTPQIAISTVLPVKRFRPWEALKGIQTDGSEVAGDLKLIQEGTHRQEFNNLSLNHLKKPTSPTSSELTELSSALSSIPDSSSDETELDDECLPESLIIHKRRLIKRKKNVPKVNENDDDTSPIEPKPYLKIRSNVWPFRKPELSDLPPAICGCKEGGCGENCLNRATLYLCDPKRCSLGQSCTNIPFNLRKDLIDESTNKLGKGLKVYWTGKKRGWGLKTEIKLNLGIFLIDYRGEIISRDMCYKRVMNDYRESNSFYFLDYDGSDVIDAGKKGNCSRFINHSCEPNLKVERYKLSGMEEYQFGLFTLRDIEVDEELCYDYNWQDFSDIAPTSNIRTSLNEENIELLNTATAPTVQRCFCGTKSCKGFLGVRKSVSNASNRENKRRRIV